MELSYNSPSDAVSVIVNYIDQHMYLSAQSEYEKLMSILSNTELWKDRETKADNIRSQLSAVKPKIDLMLKRCEDINAAYKSTSAPVDNWRFGCEVDGITTHYMIDDDGFISLRAEGILENIPLYEQLFAIYEIGLYKTWVPFCTSSKLLKQIDHLEMLAALRMNTPFGISRDVQVHAYGANCLEFNGSIVIVTRSVDEFPGAHLPPPSQGFFTDRCEVTQMYAVTRPLSPSSAEFVCTMKVDPKFRVPQTIINWFIKQLAGVAFHLIRKQARIIANNPDHPLYSERLSDNSEFYLNFLLPEFRAFVQSKGWDQPVVACLGYAGVPVPGADYSRGVLPRPMSTSSICRDKGGKGRTSSVATNSSGGFYSCHDEPCFTACDDESISTALATTPLLPDASDCIDTYNNRDDGVGPVSSETRGNDCCCRFLYCCY
mmetsp:Transcript_9975/g.15056  ORF Transcript_9975/g.15056 Transcript_9975/m.15056 type:complete len:432 (+) Transcript_9975:90-1385(+)